MAIETAVYSGSFGEINAGIYGRNTQLTGPAIPSTATIISVYFTLEMTSVGWHRQADWQLHEFYLAAFSHVYANTQSYQMSGKYTTFEGWLNNPQTNAYTNGSVEVHAFANSTGSPTTYMRNVSLTVTYSTDFAPTMDSTRPADKTVEAGASTYLDAVVMSYGSPSATLQWYRNGVLIAGQTGMRLTLNAVSQTATYVCRASNSSGYSDSRTATVVVTQPTLPPVLDANLPENKQITQGGTVTLTVEVIGGSPNNFTYQWYKNGAPISGATSANYVAQPTSNASFYCKVTNTAGTTQSRTATVEVQAAATPPQTVTASSQSVPPYSDIRIAFGGAGTIASPITGYEIYSDSSPSGAFTTLVKSVTSAENGASALCPAPNTVGETRYYKVKTITQGGGSYNSELSTAYAAVTCVNEPTTSAVQGKTNARGWQ